MENILVISSIALWVMVLLNLLLTLGLSRRLNSRLPKIESLKIGQLAPAFTAQTLHGETVTLSSYAGRGVTFIFTSPHCKPCREELPRIEALQPRADQAGIQLVLVSDADETETRSFAEEMGLELAILIAPRERMSFLADYKAIATPSYCLLDAEGKVWAAGLDLAELGEKMEAFSSGRR
jgi:peroxiredoxin